MPPRQPFTVVHLAWWCGLVIACVVAPFIGGLVVIAVTRVPPLRAGSPRLAPMLVVWGAFAVVQVAALFLSMEFSHSTDVVVR